MTIGNALCLNCGNLLNSVKNTFMSMDEIHNQIRRRNLPFVPNLYKLLGMSLVDGMQNFADIILEGKNEFEEYNTLIIKYQMNEINSRYVFKSNFFDWIDQKISPSEVEFKPSSIIQMTSNVEFNPTVRSASHWTYDKISGEFKTQWSNCILHYYTEYPMRVNLLNSSEWSEDSGIYLVEDPNYLIDQLSLNLLLRIKEYSGMIQLTGFSSQLQLDNTIERLRGRVEENRSKTSNVYAKWINRS